MAIIETLNTLFAKSTQEPKKAGVQHVYILFQDGELCLTKAGELFGQRNMHLMQHGCTGATKFLEGVNWPATYGKYQCAFFENNEKDELESISTQLRKELEKTNPLDGVALLAPSKKVFEDVKELLREIEKYYYDAQPRPELPSEFIHLPKYLERAARLEECLETSIENGSRRAVGTISGYLAQEIQNVQDYYGNIKAWFERVKIPKKSA